MVGFGLLFRMSLLNLSVLLLCMQTNYPNQTTKIKSPNET